MKILVDIGHPAHVHFLKNFIWEMQKRGHRIYINTIDKDVTIDLLNRYNLKYEVYGKSAKDLLGYANLLIKGDLKTYKTQRKYDIDIIVGIGNIFGAHISKITKAKSITFTDTEHAKLTNMITTPFTNVVLTPSCFKKDFGKKQIRYNGYHELAYLHPNYFTPNPEVLSELGLHEDDTFIILRFVSWSAAHDIGHHGIQNKIEFVKELEKYGKVLITSESKLDDALDKYRIKTSPDKLHDLLYYASLYVGDGGTTAVEGAILGTPSIYVSSLVGTMGNFIELEEKYGLVLNYNDSDEALKKAIELVKNPNSKSDWGKKREGLIRDKIDVTSFMVEFVENYLTYGRGP
ncbi:DUF354 domain-containing protein [Methanosarcina sp. KYL-1]|uniref:DUF354 domain-containing protein n=1 Tax=Methanosarcina sp. KYL-1 TaxID=2602068 RepID=UPI002101A751|nr:DUF354 domain-containing protein [Methanosarcina sp. KYL-1]MCQ1535237.1 DUF354 domain-containing protein [Methanosarcina sp. KYL-1]